MHTVVFAKRTNYLIFIVVMLYILLQHLLTITLGEKWIEQNYYLFLLFIQLFIILLPVLVFTHKYNLNPISVFRIKKISVLEALLVVMMAVSSSLIASVLNSIVYYFISKIGPVRTDHIPSPANVPELWIQIMVIAVLPAICEELFFRGVIFKAYEGLGIRTTIFLSAFYFALFHFDIRNFLGPLFLGLLIAWYCFRTGSILAGILAHFTNNLLAVLVSWYNRDISVEQTVLTDDIMGQLLVLASVVGCILVILMKAFRAVAKKNTAQLQMTKEKPPLALMFHWPLCFFYIAYLIITIRILTVITRPLL